MTINVDYIGVVKQSASSYEYAEILIPHNHGQIIHQLEEMARDSSVTACEMYNYMVECFSSRTDFSYCFPNDYCDVNYEGSAGSFPLFLKRDDYNSALCSARHEIEERMFGKDSIDQNAVDQEIRRMISKAKYTYLDSCKNYINAYEYYTTLGSLTKDSSIKMFSTEVIGDRHPISKMQFRISANLLFSIYTNFRYGQSSRFFLKMTYNGIPLLFYSDYVKYYYACATDVVRYTKFFTPTRDNWAEALNTVIQYSNMASQIPDTFEKVFIRGQIAELLSGLRNIMSGAESVGTHIEKLKKYGTDYRYIGLRTIDTNEINCYKIYPQELQIVYKCEKITGALDLLESMDAIRSIYYDIVSAINEVKELNRSLVPDIIKSLSSIEREIILLNLQINEEKQQQEVLDLKLKPYEDQRALMLHGVDPLRHQELLNAYDNEHPEYCRLRQDKFEHFKKEMSLLSEKSFRTNFRDRLKKCMERIESYEINVA